MDTNDQELEDQIGRIRETIANLKAKIADVDVGATLSAAENRIADTMGVADDPVARAEFQSRLRIGAGAVAVGALLIAGSRRAGGIGRLGALGAAAYGRARSRGRLPDGLPTSGEDLMALFEDLPGSDRVKAAAMAAFAAARSRL